MDKKLDLRIIKTYNKLTEAFGQMMKEVSFDEITVFDLCERASVRRATFYKHFNDKYDFFRNIVISVMVSIDRKVGIQTKQAKITDYITMFVKEVIVYFDSKPEILASILNSNAFPLIFDIITHCTHESLKNHLDEATAAGASYATDSDSLASFLNGGIATLLLFWLKCRHISESELLSKIEAILNKVF